MITIVNRLRNETLSSLPRLSVVSLKTFLFWILISCSPFVQRVWISLEAKKVPYQYIEVDPYKKPQSLLDVNPRGLVPALRHGDWGCYESTVLMEYVRNLESNRSQDILTN